MKNLGISEVTYKQNTYTRRDRVYRVADLIDIAKHLEPFDLPIKGIDISVYPWGEPTIKNFASHMDRINKADMQYPIILDDEGFICDGWHRLVKAIVSGDETIKAIRLTTMPECS